MSSTTHFPLNGPLSSSVRAFTPLVSRTFVSGALSLAGCGGGGGDTGASDAPGTFGPMARAAWGHFVTMPLTPQALAPRTLSATRRR